MDAIKYGGIQSKRSQTKMFITFLVLAVISAQRLAIPAEYNKLSADFESHALHFKAIVLKQIGRCQRSAESLQKRLARHILHDAKTELPKLRKDCSDLQVVQYIRPSATTHESVVLDNIPRGLPDLDSLLEGDELTDLAVRRTLYEVTIPRQSRGLSKM